MLPRSLPPLPSFSLLLAFALPLSACAAQTPEADVSTATEHETAAAPSSAVTIREFRIEFESGNHWGGYGAGLVSENALGSDGATYFLTGGAGEYGDSPESIQASADADSSLRVTYAQDGIWDGWYSESESGPGPVPHKLVSFVDVELQFRIQGGPIQTVQLSARGTDAPYALLHVPANAAGQTLEYWFRITGNDGKTYWESRNARNYHVSIKAAGSTSLDKVPHYP